MRACTRLRRRRFLLAGVSLMTASILASCSGAGDGETLVGAPPPAAPKIYALPPPVIEEAVGESDVGETDDAPAFVRNAEGVALPNPELTPGSTYPDVDAADICNPYYSHGVRNLRFPAKVAALAAYGIPIPDRDYYKTDHLVPISLGGNNTEGNLWPQPYEGAAGPPEKDRLERHLRGLVCSATMTLQEAQQAISQNWYSAYQGYMDAPIVPGSDGPPVTEPPVPSPGEVLKGATCSAEGETGITEQKQVELRCAKTSDGQLQWQRRS